MGVIQPKVPSYSPHAMHWTLDRSVCFLNHGSFGATPLEILEEQQRYRDEMEREPVRWFVETLEPRLDEARARISSFLGCPADDLAFVPNATAGVNTVVQSLKFSPGDELLVSNHEYNACNNAFAVAAERWGAKVVMASIPFPVREEEQVVQAIMDRVSDRTKLVLLSHITSPSGLILPVKRIVSELAKREIDTLVDGAHAPAFVPLNVLDIGCAYYTGNFHKWLCAPKGSAFLYVRPDRQHLIQPLSTSHGYNSQRTDRSHFRLQFDYGGTDDMTPHLCVPKCIELLTTLMPDRRVDSYWQANNDLCRRARSMLINRLGSVAGAPDDMLGAMATITLPRHDAAREERLSRRPTKYADALQDRLIAQHRIQVPIIRMAGLGQGGGQLRCVRISCNLYNTIEQYEYLANALIEELAAEGQQ